MKGKQFHFSRGSISLFSVLFMFLTSIYDDADAAIIWMLCRVPLLISHPASPFQGQHCSEPVELIDLFPTLLDLFPVNPPDDQPCDKLHPTMNRCLPLQGKSLAPVVIGTPVKDPTAPSVLYNMKAEEAEEIKKGNRKTKTQKIKENDMKVKDKDKKKIKEKTKRPAGHHMISSSSPPLSPHPPPLRISKVMPSLGEDLVAVSQSWRCADKSMLERTLPRREKGGANGTAVGPERRGGFNPFFECNRGDNRRPDMIRQQVSIMGYTFRSSTFRYTTWLHWDRVKNAPELSVRRRAL